MTNQLSIPDALSLAAEHHDAGREREAEALYWRVLGADPKQADAWNLLGLLAHANGRCDIAHVFIRRAIDLCPTCGYFHNALGRSLIGLKRHTEAVGALEWSIQLDPADADAWNNLGAAYVELDRPEDAVRVYNKSLELREGHAPAYANLCSAYRTLGKLDEAIAAGEKAIELRPTWADAHWNLALALLTAGRFEAGWREFEWRWGCSTFNSPIRQFKCPVWQGESLFQKTICVWGEQGAGDAIQMARYLKVLESRGAIVMTCFDTALDRLMPPNRQTDEHDGALDYHVPVMSLPLTLGMYEPYWDGAYIHAEPTDLPGDEIRVGLCWAGNPNHHNDRNRSLSADAFEPLRVDGVAFYSLQKGHDAPLWMVDLTPKCADFADTAALIANLDLVITVDTSIAHLAGAMGKPVWIILPREGADWRWGVRDEQSAWYPSARLFRGGRAAVGDVAKELRAMVASRKLVLS